MGRAGGGLPRGRAFDQDDINYLQSFANLLAAAVERLRSHEQISDLAERREILLQELRHRVGNMLGNIRALVHRTADASSNVEEFTEAFDNRLDSLIRTQDLLTRAPNGRDVPIDDILRQELEAHGTPDDGRVALSGPAEASVSSRAAQALAMAFHELATNASKHGAFARQAGRINVSWAQLASADGEEIQITWRETGVPIEEEPKRKSLGFQLIDWAVLPVHAR